MAAELKATLISHYNKIFELMRLVEQAYSYLHDHPQASLIRVSKLRLYIIKLY